jgi:hypothetical protein
MSKHDDGLRSIMHANLRSFHWQAIESGLTSRGIPDSNGCGSGVEFWCESKANHGGWALKIDTFQVSWHERRLRNGGRTFITVRRRIEQVRTQCDEFYLFHGSCVRELMTKGMYAVKPLLVSSGGPSQWNWKKVESLLLQTSFSPSLWKTI